MNNFKIWILLEYFIKPSIKLFDNLGYLNTLTLRNYCQSFKIGQ
jgi:hypothetical protein